MAMNSLKDVYIDQLQDIYSACKQSKDVTKELRDAATNDALKSALDAGIDVCSGYSVRAFVEDDFGARQDTIALSATSGACTMPSDASIEHWIEFDLPPRSVAGS